jgi:hypothetical protein
MVRADRVSVSVQSPQLGHGADAGGAAVGSGKRLGVTAGRVRGRINAGVAGRGPRGVRMGRPRRGEQPGGRQSRRV